MTRLCISALAALGAVGTLAAAVPTAAAEPAPVAIADRQASVAKRALFAELRDGDANSLRFGHQHALDEHVGDDADGTAVPIAFRPLHENNGSWFWWGATHASTAEYKELFRYIVDYLRDAKGVHNLPYAYSPTGSFNGDPTNYLATYPGDAWVDLLGYDQYMSSGTVDTRNAEAGRCQNPGCAYDAEVGRHGQAHPEALCHRHQAAEGHAEGYRRHRQPVTIAVFGAALLAAVACVLMPIRKRHS
ncbi:glycoside hydrolase family 26 protein [Bifidobacterium cuniculi]|uniref:Mannan endo-1,4-beta-mannosidase n=1 Tax=Bifidobacterium cuniculi TaxID=1688 RepID=A0A087AII0_9BIFI|nr:glycosyl hydrolase [Bifidobacterium cuniculi]KFI58580.1 mannan endo-1,4-beta-mannosidase [Bifidobacterium cuniculi]